MNIQHWTRYQHAHDDPMIAYALQKIYRDHGHQCVVNRKDLEKFGGNPSVGTTEVDIVSWNADETLQTSNVVLNMASDDAADTDIEITIEHMTLQSGNLHFGIMTATTNGSDGRTIVALPTAAARWTRMFPTNGQAVQGNISLFRGTATDGVPDTTGNIHCQIPAGENISQKAATSIAYNNYFLMFYKFCDIVRNNTAAAAARFKVARVGEAFQTFPRRGITSNNSLNRYWKSPRIILPNSDIKWTGQTLSGTADMTAGFEGLFADIHKGL